MRKSPNCYIRIPYHARPKTKARVIMPVTAASKSRNRVYTEDYRYSLRRITLTLILPLFELFGNRIAHIRERARLEFFTV